MLFVVLGSCCHSQEKSFFLASLFNPVEVISSATLGFLQHRSLPFAAAASLPASPSCSCSLNILSGLVFFSKLISSLRFSLCILLIKSSRMKIQISGVYFLCLSLKTCTNPLEGTQHLCSSLLVPVHCSCNAGTKGHARNLESSAFKTDLKKKKKRTLEPFCLEAFQENNLLGLAKDQTFP